MTNISRKKECPCIKCGLQQIISKFQAPNKVLCDSCKSADNPSPADPIDPADSVDIIIHPNNKQWIEHKPNKALYSLSCPFHINDQMEVINVIKDTRWGDKVILQCQICSTIVDIIDGNKKEKRPITMKDGVDWTEDVSRIKQQIEESNTLSRTNLADDNKE